MKFIDTHAHIYSRKFDHDREEVILNSRDLGVSRIYMPNIDLESIDWMLELEEKFPGLCFPTMGLHPCDVKPGFEQTLYAMEDWISRREFAAIGETGLDLYWDKTYFGEQQEALSVQIGWAKKKGWPIILHCRDSMEQVIDLVKSLHDDRLTGIFHCFSGTRDQAREITDMGFYLGIGGTATYKNSGVGDLLLEIGLDKVVLETDSPYLAPVPYRGKRNSPEYIPVIAQHLARLLGEPLEKVAEITTKNALNVFNSPGDEL